MIQKYDNRNKDILVWIDGKLYHRDNAKVSVFDSLVQGGDGVWEGLRVYNGRIFCLYEHLDRLFDSARSMNFDNIPSLNVILKAINDTLKANNMRTDTHIRITMSRGRKITSGMNPKLNQFGTTLIVLAEWKPAIYHGVNIKLITANIRRNSPLCLDSKIHHNNLINNILAKIESNNAGVDDAIMLDLYGFVAETNSTNIFMIRNQVVYTPIPNSCLPGITRSKIIEICIENNIKIVEQDISITQLYNADEVFTTGTMGELARVINIDKRDIRNKGGMLKRLQELFRYKTKNEGIELTF